MKAVTNHLFAIVGSIALMMISPSLAGTAAPTNTSAPTMSPTDDTNSTGGSVGRSYCPVCASTTVGRNYLMERVYPNWGIQCQSLGDATSFGLDCTEDIQARFGAFCGCPGAVAGCTICSDGGSVPNPKKTIPFALTTSKNTCGELDAYASVRLETECQDYLDEYPYNASAFCGCGGGTTTPSASTCSFCSGGLSVIKDKTITPVGSTTNTTCEEIADFAQYVTDSSYCDTKVQPYETECCY